ncbi:MAG: hypothetical protein POELPBGB_03289 [Bacteroidia bacterium]|nr:hypothetical protein [Bacteroidia bacterium]
MGKLNNYIFYFILSLLFLGCTNAENENSFNHQSIDTLILNDNSKQISISSNKNPVSFRLKINNRFPLSITDMLDSIRQISKLKKIPREQAAWEFVAKNTFHSHPLTEKCSQHSSEIFLNSVGGGLCESRATTLADLWQKMQFDSRVINLVNYHVVAEVFSAGKWKMYDADNEIFYYNDMNQIASFRELREQPELIAKPYKNYDFKNPFTENNMWTEKLAQWYGLSEIDTISWQADSINDVRFSLPPNTTMTMYSENNKNIYSIIVELTDKSNGLLKLPFLPYAATGSFSFLANGSVYSVSNTDTIIFQHSELIKSLKILEVTGTSQIIYMVNPSLNVLSKTTTVAIESTEDLCIKTIEVNKNAMPFFLPNRTALERLFLDSILNSVYLDYLVTSVNYKTGNIDTYLASEYVKFLSLDKSLTEKEKELFRNKFQEQLPMHLSELGSSKEDFVLLLNKYHPLSLYYLFSSVRYNKSEFLLETWRKHFDTL